MGKRSFLLLIIIFLIFLILRFAIKKTHLLYCSCLNIPYPFPSCQNFFPSSIIFQYILGINICNLESPYFHIGNAGWKGLYNLSCFIIFSFAGSNLKLFKAQQRLKSICSGLSKLKTEIGMIWSMCNFSVK